MSKEKNIVILAAYPNIDAAKKNFDQLVQLVKEKKVETDGMIMVEKDQEGNLSVSETGDHLGRKGMGWGAGVGLLVGLAAPPLLASVAVGAAGGALVGKFAKQKVVKGMEEGLGEKLHSPIGMHLIDRADTRVRLRITHRVGEVEDALGIEDQVVGTAEMLPFVFAGEDMHAGPGCYAQDS